VLAIEVKTNVLERAMRYPLSERSQMRACRTPAGSASLTRSPAFASPDDVEGRGAHRGTDVSEDRALPA
jgi:hypothetical protein